MGPELENDPYRDLTDQAQMFEASVRITLHRSYEATRRHNLSKFCKGLYNYMMPARNLWWKIPPNPILMVKPKESTLTSKNF